MLYNAPDYTNFLPTTFKTVTPEHSGMAPAVGIADDKKPIYGYTKQADFVAVDHRGYIFAQQTGDYTFTFPTSDEITLLWVGPNAYSGWTRENANVAQTWDGTGTNTKTYSASFVKGKYYPIRILWANSMGPGSFKTSLTAPDGSTILGPEVASSPVLVQFSCDSTTAPPFPAWGSET